MQFSLLIVFINGSIIRLLINHLSNIASFISPTVPRSFDKSWKNVFVKMVWNLFQPNGVGIAKVSYKYVYLHETQTFIYLVEIP